MSIIQAVKEKKKKIEVKVFVFYTKDAQFFPITANDHEILSLSAGN